jgi:Malectin domain
MVSFSEPQPSSVPSQTGNVHAQPPSKQPHDAENGADRVDDTMADDTDSCDSPEVVQHRHHHRILKIPRQRRRRRPWLLLFWLAMGWVMVAILATRLLRYRHAEPSTNKDDSNFAVRINSGAATPYSDQEGREWLAEAVDFSVEHTAPFVVTNNRNEILYTVNGDGYLFDSTRYSYSTARKPIPNAGVEGVGLYRDERYFRTNGVYTIPVPKRKAWYRVDLYFCEVYFGSVGQRLFDIYVQGDLIRENFDIVAAAGGYNFTAVVVSHSVYVRHEDTITVDLESIVEHAKISGIQVQSL